MTADGGGPKKVLEDLFELRRNRLSQMLEAISLSPEAIASKHADRVLVWVEMSPDSQATSHTPKDIFDPERVQANIACAWRTGYVVDISHPAGFKQIIGRLNGKLTRNECADVSRITKAMAFSAVLLDGVNFDHLWNIGQKDKYNIHPFLVRLPPFTTVKAIQSVEMELIKQLQSGSLMLMAEPNVDVISAYLDAPRLTAERRDIAPFSSPPSEYRWLPAETFSNVQTLFPAGKGKGRPAITIGLHSLHDLRGLISSGRISKWDAVIPLQPMPAGAGAEPDIGLQVDEREPIIGVIDGGYHGRRYRNAVAWEEKEFIPYHMADRSHGNKVTALTVDAHAWSNNLKLPELNCRVGVVQAVARRGSGVPWSTSALLSYLDQIFLRQRETNVWNLSANLPYACDEYSVSPVGHGLSALSRKHNKLLVISAGNHDGRVDTRISPPADCEAALVVGGRMHGPVGDVAGPCAVSCRGPGPEGMLKPEASWFSQHRVLGGNIETGTSFAAPLISRLAAHTWANLEAPTPDLVRALIIQASDLHSYSNDLGFGSPVTLERPWLCPSNTVTLAWTANIRKGAWYRWTGIAIPPSMIRAKRFVGRAKLVAILDPLIQEDGHAYCCTRLHAALHYVNRSKNEVRLIGSMADDTAEITARSEDAKWQPVRCYFGEFTNASKRERGSMELGPLLGSRHLIVKARMYWRNKFMFSDEFMNGHERKVTFALRLESFDPDADTYNEFRQLMHQDVQSAVIESDIQLGNEDLE